MTKPFTEKELRLCGNLSLEILTNISCLCTPLIYKNKIQTQYFDDSDYTFLTNGIALRSRIENEKGLLELKIDKGHGTSLEWNTVVHDKNILPFTTENYPDFPTEKELKEKSFIPQMLRFTHIMSRSKRIFKTDIFRTKWLVLYKDSTFEICYDEGEIICNDRKATINELEIESVHDNKEYLLEFFEIIWKQLPRTFFQGKSKALRGLELTENWYLISPCFKKKKGSDALPFRRIKTVFLDNVTNFVYTSSLYCESAGKSGSNSLRNSLSKIKRIFFLLCTSSVMLERKQMRTFVKHMKTMEAKITLSPREKKLTQKTILLPPDATSIYESQANMIMSLYKVIKTLNKFLNLH
tara:strand:- start:748 stop:1806 length:1059 start_codon:yes stop_codon:yes gene_type:complete